MVFSSYKLALGFQGKPKAYGDVLWSVHAAAGEAPPAHPDAVRGEVRLGPPPGGTPHLSLTPHIQTTSHPITHHM